MREVSQKKSKINDIRQRATRIFVLRGEIKHDGEPGFILTLSPLVL
jgi:hypothetical protein